MRGVVSLSLFIALLLALGLGGFWVKQNYLSEMHSDNFHYRIHHELKLDAKQDAAIEELEQRFATEKATIEARLREANTRLGVFIKEDKSMSPRVRRTVAEINDAMGEMQKLTLQHIFDMTGALKPEQKDKFYGLVADAFARSP